MPLPSQSRHQKWSGGGAEGSHIPAPPRMQPPPRNEAFMDKRARILRRDHNTCHVCGKFGKLIDLSCDKCICERCLDG